MTVSKKKTEYSKKLDDPRWQKKRLEILDRDDWTCQECGNKEDQLQVHHLHYEDDLDPWEYDESQLITLCKECHGLKHKNPADNKFAQYPAKLINSQAFQALNAPGHRILAYVRIQLTIKNIGTKRKPKFACINKNEIQILYAVLAKKPWSMANAVVTRGIDELLHKGFIKVIEQGGRAKGHVSVYGLVDNYLKWTKGDSPVSVRRPYRKRGFCAKEK